MFSSGSSPYSSQRRGTVAARKSKGMQRSGSIFSTIGKIVSAPLSWFSSDNGDDLGKRQRIDDQESSENELVGSVRKKMRVDSPPPPRSQQPFAGGYLDPPAASVRRSQSNVLPRTTLRSRSNFNASRASVVRAPSINGARTMSVDPPPAQYASYRDPAFVPLPLDSPMQGMRSSVSVGPRDTSMHPPVSPFRIRTSLTPQPSPTKHLRREGSAPPPLASLMSRPVFVKPPIEEEHLSNDLRAQKTMSLGSIAEFNRPARSPSRGLHLNSLSSLHTVPTQLSFASTASVSTTTSEKTFRDLEMFKTPIIPSRYRDAKVIPEFLRPKKSHVPIPMSRKGKDDSPSLGMGDKGKGIAGKPYAGKSRLSKLLEKGVEEGKRASLESMYKEGETQPASGKRDVGVSAHGSESEDILQRRVSSHLKPTDNPFYQPSSSYDRNQPYGRVGRTRTSRATADRPLSLSSRKFGNRFSATFDDDDSIEDVNVDGEPASKDKFEKDIPKPLFEAPVGFSFAKEAPIQHNITDAKEPPIVSLPFSFAKTPNSNGVAEAPQSSSLNATPQIAPVGGPFTPAQSASKQADLGGFDIPIPVKQVPKVAVVPPTPEQSLSTGIQGVVPNFFAQPPANKIGTTAILKSGGIPNFFANSSFLTGDKAPTAPVTPTIKPASSIPSAPMKDSANPLWEGDTFGAPNTSTSSARPTSPKPPPFGGFSKPSAFQSASVNGSALNATSTSFGYEAKQPDLNPPSTAEQRPSSAPVSTGFASTLLTTSSFGSGSRPGVSQVTSSSGFTSLGQPKPTEPSSGIHGDNVETTPLTGTRFSFGPQTPSASQSDPPRPFSAPISTSASQNDQGNEKPVASPFTFGAPSSSADASKPSGVPGGSFAPKPLFGTGIGNLGQSTTASSAEANKSPFTFGAPPATPPAAADPKSAFSSFGTPSTSGGFSFASPAKAPDMGSSATPSTPFSFGNTAARQITPPNKNDEMSMEESPTRFDSGGKMDANGTDANGRPSLSLNFGGVASTTSSSSGFTFGSSGTSVSNPFAPKSADDAPKSNGFSFANNSSTAPPVSATFSFGQKSEGGSSTPTTTGFGSGTTGGNPFAQSTTPTASTSFSFNTPPVSGGSTAVSNSFGAPPMQQTSSFTFGTSTTTPNNPFSFGSQPASPATSAPGLPQSPATSNVPFTFGQPSSGGTSTSSTSFGGSSSGGALFNIGSAPPPQGGTGTSRLVKKLPRRGASVKR